MKINSLKLGTLIFWFVSSRPFQRAIAGLILLSGRYFSAIPLSSWHQPVVLGMLLQRRPTDKKLAQGDVPPLLLKNEETDGPKSPLVS